MDDTLTADEWCEMLQIRMDWSEYHDFGWMREGAPLTYKQFRCRAFACLPYEPGLFQRLTRNL